MAWSDGYVTELNYNFGYYSELNPLRASASLTAAGLRAPTIRNACELGFGQGVSLGINAAAEADVTWWGTDFNPSQAGYAQHLVTASGATAHVFDQSFEEFAQRDDLPEFEFIALHGIWSWVSDASRKTIVDFVRKKLAVGGILYVSYNTLPGWTTSAPLRHLMKEHHDRQSSAGLGMATRVDEAMNFIDKLLNTDNTFIRLNPNVKEKFDAMKSHGRDYLAHEYFNSNWRPMYFSEMADWLEDAKVTFVGSANPLEQQDSLNMTADQLAMLYGIADQRFRETVRDFIINQQFRRDLWVRGARRMTSLEHSEAHREARYMLVTAREDISPEVRGRQGPVTMNAAIYDPIINLLADHQPRTLAEIERAVIPAGLSIGQVISALGVLVGIGAAAPIQSDKAATAAKATCDRLNLALMMKARSSGEIIYLASPVLGGGVPVTRFDQLFILAQRDGHKTPQAWAQVASGVLAAQGQQLIRDGRTLETPEENVAELLRLAQEFERKRQPVLRLLGVA